MKSLSLPTTLPPTIETNQRTNLELERRVLPLPEPLPVSDGVEVVGVRHLGGLLLVDRREKEELKAEVCDLKYIHFSMSCPFLYGLASAVSRHSPGPEIALSHKRFREF